jgi:hypothetical protein
MEPKAVMDVRDYSSQKRLRRLDYMGKSNGPFSPLYRMEFAGDWLARCDTLQKFR